MNPEAFRTDVLAQFGLLKKGPYGSRAIGEQTLQLLPVTSDFLAGEANLGTLADWRRASLATFPRIEEITLEGTRTWSKRQLIEREDRILFMIAEQGIPVGHIGLANIDYARSSCEFDNVIRGSDQASKGVMTRACELLIDWTYETLGATHIWVKTFLDNHPAIALYHRVGFRVRTIEPLLRREKDGVVDYAPCQSLERIDRFSIIFDHRRDI